MLEIRDLCAETFDKKILLDHINLTVADQEVFGLTGESGCGKTTLIKSIMRLLRAEQVHASGSILLDGTDLLALPERKHAMLRGATISLIPQSPMTAFDRSVRIGAQIKETFRCVCGMSGSDAEKRANEILDAIFPGDTARILKSFPAQLSGGMLQRIAVATVFALKPKLLLADEPSSALDEENARIILDLICSETDHMSVLLVTHDAGALKRHCNRMAVMHDGKIVETGTVSSLYAHPQSPHTLDFVQGLQGKRKESWQWKALSSAI